MDAWRVKRAPIRSPRMPRTPALCLVILAVLAEGCCFDGLTTPAIAPPTAPPTGPGTGTGPLLPGGPSAGGIGAPISFGSGTIPDPVIVQGVAGGPVSASVLDPTCYGHVQVAPSHVLTVTSVVPQGRIMAFSTRGSDLTLMVRLPSGTYLCNDDSDGLNPQIETLLYPGDYQIFVGTYGTSAGEPYELGVSANPSVTSSTLHYPPPFVAATIGSVLLAGGATVASVSGAIPGVSPGSACTYTQTRTAAPVPGSGGATLDCVWLVTCGGTDVYGGAIGGGYQPCADPMWPPGFVARDAETETVDSDPMFVFDGTQITISDDSAGSYGTFTLILSTPTAPVPLAPIAAPFPELGS
jgi:hypothetical protein